MQPAGIVVVVAAGVGGGRRRRGRRVGLLLGTGGRGRHHPEGDGGGEGGEPASSNHRGLQPLEDRRALLQEGGDGLRRVRGGEVDRLGRALVLERLLQRDLERRC